MGISKQIWDIKKKEFSGRKYKSKRLPTGALYAGLKIKLDQNLYTLDKGQE